MMGAKYASGAERDGLAATYRRLWLTSSVLACAVLVVALIGAWGFSATTAYESAATLLYGTMTSERPSQTCCAAGMRRHPRPLQPTHGPSGAFFCP